MGLQAQDIGDLFSGTLAALGRGKWTDLSSDVPKHLAMNRLMSKKRMRVFDGGTEFHWNVMTGHNGSARFVPLGYTAEVNVSDQLIQGSHPFRYLTSNWSMEKREIAHNSGDANKVIDLMKWRRKAAMISIVEKLETAFWRLPAAGDTETPHGVQYWVVKSATAITTNNGFNGGAPSGYTTVGGLNPSTAASGRWKNYAAPYVNVSKADLVATLDHAMDRTDFEPPVDMPTYNAGDDYELLCGRTVRKGLKDIAESQNDNLGFDLDPAYGKVRFRRAPITWVPVLDNDADNPIYGINWGQFFVATLRGQWMVDTVFKELPNQPTTMATHTDSVVNFATYDRRRHFVISNGTTGSV